MRVRLINPFLCEIARLDTVATAAGPPGYDADFQEPKVYAPGGVRTEGRKEKTLIRVRAQVEDQVFNQLRALAAGNAPEAKIGIVVDYRDLKKDGLVTASGLPAINVNDRLVAIYTRSGVLVHQVANPPGLFCVEVRPISYGIGGQLNLVLIRFNERQRSTEKT